MIKCRKLGKSEYNLHTRKWKRACDLFLCNADFQGRSTHLECLRFIPHRVAIRWKCRMHALAIFHLFAGPRCAWRVSWRGRRGGGGAQVARAVRVEPLPSEPRPASSHRPAEQQSWISRWRWRLWVCSGLKAHRVVVVVVVGFTTVQQVKRCKWFALTKVPVTISPVGTTTAPNTLCGRICGPD